MQSNPLLSSALAPNPRGYGCNHAFDSKFRSRSFKRKCAGLTLVEVMIAFSLFTVMALASLSALIQTRKMSENNVAQETAAVIAQGIIEQVQLNPYDDIKDNTSGLHPNLALKFTGSNSNNLASIQQGDVPWALDSTTFNDIGARTDPADLTSPILGVLIDMDYKVGTQVIRPKRYMKMKVNITRNVHVSDNNIEVILTYSWQPPTGNGAASAPYLTREIRTVRSEAASY